MRYGAGLVPDDLDVLAGGVEHLEHRLVPHQLEERLEVDPGGQRVDHDGFLRTRHLHDAEQGIVRRLPEEPVSTVMTLCWASREQAAARSEVVVIRSMNNP